MRFRAGKTCAEFAFFAFFCATRGTADGQYLLLFDFHGYTMRRRSATRWSIVTIAQSFWWRIILQRHAAVSLINS
jgi:hypothetical protein